MSAVSEGAKKIYDTTLNNTVLMPASDSLVSGNPLAAFDPVATIEGEENLKTLEPYTVFIKLDGKNSVQMENVQRVSGLSMTRDNQQRPGSVKDYVANLPGPIKYGDVSITHTFTTHPFFLKWLTAGSTQGGATKADVEIHLKDGGKDQFVFTLRNAFPVGWELCDLDTHPKENSPKTIQETITLAFSSVTLSPAAKTTMQPISPFPVIFGS